MKYNRSRNVIIIKDDKPEKEYKLNKRSFWVNVLIAGAAIGALIYSGIQTKLNTKAVKIAEQTLNDTKENNKKIFDEQRRNSDSTAVENKRQFELQQKSVEAQIASLRALEKTFNANFSASLQLADAVLTSSPRAGKSRINFVFSNISQQPVIVTESRMAINIIDDFSFNKDKQRFFSTIKPFKRNRFTSNNIPFEGGVDYNIKPTTITEKLTDEKLSVFFYGYIFYTNKATNTKNRYMFVVKIKSLDNDNFDLYESDNKILAKQ